MLTEIRDTVRKGYAKLISPPEVPTAAPAKAPKERLVGIGADFSRDVLQVAARLDACEALQKKAHIKASNYLVKSLGLPSHHDPQKDWDTLKVLHYTLESCSPGEAFLDAGSGTKSVILRWLHLLGYQNLWACDRIPLKSESYEKRGIQFSVQDLAKTSYKDAQFKAIGCVSVIEHGVDLKTFFVEMARILMPGGVLTVSTDYWSSAIDCSGIYPYGEEYGLMKVFTAEDASRMVEYAKEAGLELCHSLDLFTDEKAVRWERVNREYTFLFLAFRRK